MLLLLFTLLFNLAGGEEAKQQHLPPYEKPDSIDDSLWQSIQGYLVPPQSKIRAQLDSLFKNKKFRVISSESSLKKAGFRMTIQVNHTSGALILKHKKLSGYLVKLYTDDSFEPNSLMKLIKRINGAAAAREAISYRQAESYFKVPHKWIYPLPKTPYSSRPGKIQKDFLLVVEDMDIIHPHANRKWWRSSNPSRQQLDLLWLIITDAGLFDCNIPDNVPYSYDKKIAFVDTEHFHGWPIYYKKFAHYLSPENADYWVRKK